MKGHRYLLLPVKSSTSLSGVTLHITPLSLLGKRQRMKDEGGRMKDEGGRMKDEKRSNV